MKKILLSTLTMLLCLTTSAQSAIDADFETGSLPDGWTATAPSGNTGVFSVVKYSDETALNATNVGTNDLGGTYVLKSKTGGLRGVKTDSDNWFTSSKFTVSTDNNVFSFRLAANCSYSPTVDAENKMQMDLVVIEGDTKTVIGTIAPENYFTWKQYAFDLSAYADKEIQLAFHDYGTGTNVWLADMKYIDNIKLSSEKLCDYGIEEVEPLHGQALYNQAYTIKVTNYGISTGTFTANYSYGETTVSETVTSDIASGKSMNYTFQKNPTFTPGNDVTFKAWISVTGDAMTANDALADYNLHICPIQSIPYSLSNKIDTLMDVEADTIKSIECTGDEITDEFTANSYGKNYSYWNYMTKYHAWVYSHTKAETQYPGYSGVIYLYSNKAFSLPKGKVYLETIGTATLTDNYYEVYIAKYGGDDMVDYATKVGQSEVLRDVTSTGGGIDRTTVELTIPEAGDYVIAYRPMTELQNSQMTIIGYSLSTEKPTAIQEIENGELKIENSPAYNLAGQRVNANSKGIIIRGGKKYINK